MKKLIVLVFILFTVSFSFAQDKAEIHKLPSVNIRTLDGETFNTADIYNDGNPILISFWALWCKPCKNEMDAYNDVYEDWQDETGVKIIAVSIDDARSTTKVQPFVNGKSWEMEVLLDPNGDFKRAMNVNMIPHTFLIDGMGNIVYQHTSYYEGLEEEIYELVQLVAEGKEIPETLSKSQKQAIMKRILLILTLFIFCGWAAQAQFMQDVINKSEVHGSFQFDGVYYQPDEALGITDSTINGRNFGINGFGKIVYTLGNFSAGFRYEMYLPPLQGFDPRLEGQGFPNIWASYTHEKFSFTVGSFYEQFGNGLTFRTYEEWMLGYDNAMNGARVTFEPIKGLIFKGVYGVQRFFWEKWEPNGRGTVKGLDGEIDFNQVVKGMNNSKFRLIIGGSAVSKYQGDNNPKYNLPENVSNIGARFNMGYSGWNLNAEYAWKVNDPSAINKFIYKDGEALLVSLTYSRKGFGFFGMFKRLDNMSYRSDRTVTANALDINFLPPNTEIHTYMLTAMYPYATQPNGEIGFQLQVNYTIPKKSALGGKYGMKIALNYSQSNNIVRNQVNDTTPVGESGTLGWESPFFEFGNPVFWQDFNVEINKRFNKKFRGTFQYMYQTYDIAVMEGHTGEPTVYSNIAVIDMTYRFNRYHALKWELQGLWTDRDDGDWAALLLEYTISPNWFFAVWNQYNYGNSISEDQLHYYNFQFGYTRRTTRIALGYGRQRDGVVCVGGVCRAVPASNGFTFTVSTTF